MKRVVKLAAAGFWVMFTGNAMAQSPAAGSQAIYDRAQADFDAGHWSSAATGFVQLLPSNPAQTLGRSQAVIAYRYADALMHQDRLDEAHAWIDRALPTLTKEHDPRLLAEVLVVKGSIARYQYDDQTAVAAFDEADRLLGDAKPDDLLYSVRIGLALSDMTRDPTHVLARLTLLTSAPDFRKSNAPLVRAEVEDMEARAALNAGDLPSAWTMIQHAIDDSGGLTEQASTTQVAIRGDAGVIASLRHDDENAERYLAFTGAGHLTNASWVDDHTGELPVCGDTADSVRADDLAVVTFTIADDGRVVSAKPIYANRPGEVGQTFAQAASSWRWNPASIQKVPTFWRSTLQLELRCVNRPPTLEVEQTSRKLMNDWLLARGLMTPKEAAFAKEGGDVSVSAGDPRLKGPDGAVLSATDGPVPANDQAMDSLWSQLDAAHAPPAAYALLVERYAGPRRNMDSFRVAASLKAQGLAKWLPRLQARFPNDPATLGATLEEALELQTAGDYAAAAPYLNALVALPDAQLAKDDPLRAIALLHLAITLDHGGHAEAARQMLAESGLNRNQCSMFDTHPLPQNMRIGAEAFPQAAQRWSFEGFVKTDYGIANDGRVENVRAVVSYPPFVFEETTTKAVSNFRFEPPRLGGQAVGCEDVRQNINYRLGR